VAPQKSEWGSQRLLQGRDFIQIFLWLQSGKPWKHYKQNEWLDRLFFAPEKGMSH